MISSLDQGVTLRRYQTSGVLLVSEQPLPELVPARPEKFHEPPDICLRLVGNHDNQFLTPCTWFLTMTLPSGEPWLSCGKIEADRQAHGRAGYLLRFPDLADFFVDANGREILCKAAADVPSDTLRHLILNQVLPLTLNLRGQEALHATAVLTPHGVCAFTGQAGAGKSTLAASFLLAGYPVISDDCLALEERQGQIRAIPAYPELRLWEDSFEALYQSDGRSLPIAHYTSKRRVAFKDHLADFPTVPQPLIRIYVLAGLSGARGQEDSAAPVLERIAPRDSFMALLTSLFRLDVTDRAMLTRQFHFLDRLLSLVPVRRLRIPSAFSALPETRETILTDLQTSE